MKNFVIILFLLCTGFAFAQTKPAAEPACDASAKNVPEVFLVTFETTAGNFVLEAHKSWSPLGVKRLYELVCVGFFDDSRFYRVVPKFIVQFGVAGKPRVNDFWLTQHIPDEPVKQSNRRGTVSFAMPAMPNSRTSQIFINLSDNGRLDSQGFSPIGKIVDGMDNVDKLYGGYGEDAAGGIRGGKQDKLFGGGNAYMDHNFPKLDKLIRATIIVPEPAMQEKNTKK